MQVDTRFSARGGGFWLGGLLGTLAATWWLHAACVLGSALSLSPLSGRAWAFASLLVTAPLGVWLARWAGAHTQGDRTGLPLAAAAQAPARWLLWLGVAALTVAACVAVLFPIIAYDALAYRLPVIAQWLDAGRVSWVDSDDPVRNGYPLGHEAIAAVLAAASGNLRLSALPSFAFVAQGALAVGYLAAASGIRPALAKAAAGVYLLVPMTLLNAPSGYVDAAFAGATVAWLCLLAAFACGAGPRRVLAVAAGFAGAGVLAVKGTGLPFVVLPLAATGARALWLWRKREAPLPELSHVAWLLACASPGAFWTVRNLVHTGNPLWPVSLVVAGHTVFPGVGTMEQVLDTAHNTPAELAALPGALRVAFTWLQLHGPANDFDDRFAGLGFAWALFAVPALVLLVARQARARSKSVELTPIAWVLVLTGCCLLLQPLKWWPRYTLWLWGAGALALAAQGERWASSPEPRLAHRLQAALYALCLLCGAEGAWALSRAQGLDLVVLHVLQTRSLAGLYDLHHPVNAASWVDPELWTLGLAEQTDVCRGAWKPGTDNANLDGVFAQLSPRPKVHVVPDDAGGWPDVRKAARRLGCGDFVLLSGSPVLASARRDPSVSVETKMAFDPLLLVRTAATQHPTAVPP